MKHFINIQDGKGERIEQWETEEIMKLIRTANMMDIRIRKDSIEYNFEADFLKSKI